MPETTTSTAAQPTAVLPSAAELSTWVDLLGQIQCELTGENAPVEVSSTAAVVRAGQVASMRLWLTGAYRIALAPRTGGAISNDPDQHPIG